MPYAGTISEYQSGVDLVVEWKISNFFTLSEEDEADYFSPDFFFGGESWYLGTAPNGSSERDSSGHVDLYLGSTTVYSCRLSFSLSLKTAKGEKHHEEHYTRDFKNWPEYLHEFNRFIPRSELAMRSSELVPEGVLTVVCTMKSSTSAGNYTLKWIEQNFNETPKGKKRKIEEKNTGNDSEHASVGASSQCVGASSQYVVASTQHVEASTKNVEASTKNVEASTKTVEVSTQTAQVSTLTVEASTQTVEEKYEATTSGSSTNSQEKKALHDFKDLFFKKEDCDVTIRVKGSEFPTHRVILKAHSPVLASTYQHDMKESVTGVLEINDCYPSSFSDFLCFLYCADMQLITQKSVFDLFTLADKYQVLDLRSKCLEFMTINLTIDTFCETITLALRHSETELVKLSTDYFKKNAPKIIVTVKWQTFLAENPTESNELFIKLLVPNNS